MNGDRNMGQKNPIIRALVVVVLFFVAAKLIGGGASLIVALFKLGFTAVVVLFLVIAFSVFLFKKDEGKKGEQPKADPAPEPQPEPPKQEEAKFEPEPDLTDSERDALEKSGRVLEELRVGVDEVEDGEVKAAAEDVCRRIERILKTLRKQPDEISNARQCLTYYLPTLRDVIARYLTLESAGTLSDGMVEKTLKFLGQVREAMDKQYESLFDNEALDLSVDMEAMRIALKRDGLL